MINGHFNIFCGLYTRDNRVKNSLIRLGSCRLNAVPDSSSRLTSYTGVVARVKAG